MDILEKCISGNTDEVLKEREMSYENLTIQDCFILYHAYKIVSKCDGDSEKVKFMEEK